MAASTVAAKKFDGYIRVSRVNGRSGDSYRSPQDQRDAIERIAQAHGLTLGEVVIEEDVSGGKKAEERELGRLKEKALAGETGGIITWKLSRISRSLRDGVATVLDITDAGGRVIGTDLDTDQPMAKAMLGFLLGYAEEELDARRAGWKVAVDGAIERGVYIGATPVGFTKDEATKTLRRNKDSEAVREVFLGRARGRSWNKLAEELEAAGVKTATGKTEWHMNSVRSLVQNPIYKGILVNGHEHFFSEYALVTGEEWDAAQERKQGAPRRDYGAWALLSGLVFCSGCGKRMQPTRDRGYAYYRCPSPTRHCTVKARAKADELEALVVEGALDEFAHRVSQAGVGHDQDIEKLTQLEDNERRAKAAVRTALTTLDMDDAEDAETLEALKAEHEASKAALDAERRSTRRFPTADEVRAVLAGEDIEAKREAIRRVVAEVTVSKTGTVVANPLDLEDGTEVESTDISARTEVRFT